MENPFADLSKLKKPVGVGVGVGVGVAKPVTTKAPPVDPFSTLNQKPNPFADLGKITEKAKINAGVTTTSPVRTNITTPAAVPVVKPVVESEEDILASFSTFKAKTPTMGLPVQTEVKKIEEKKIEVTVIDEPIGFTDEPVVSKPSTNTVDDPFDVFSSTKGISKTASNQVVTNVNPSNDSTLDVFEQFDNRFSNASNNDNNNDDDFNNFDNDEDNSSTSSIAAKDHIFAKVNSAKESSRSTLDDPFDPDNDEDDPFANDDDEDDDEKEKFRKIYNVPKKGGVPQGTKTAKGKVFNGETVKVNKSKATGKLSDAYLNPGKSGGVSAAPITTNAPKSRAASTVSRSSVSSDVTIAEDGLPTSGEILARVSTRTLFFAKNEWQRLFWVIDNYVLYLYRSRADYEDGGGYNHSKCKKIIPITQLLRPLKIKSKEYESMGVLHNFMLEDIKDYGPSNLAKFASEEMPEVKGFHLQLRRQIQLQRQKQKGSNK
jgi:hypothetical protein